MTYGELSVSLSIYGREQIYVVVAFILLLLIC